MSIADFEHPERLLVIMLVVAVMLLGSGLLAMNRQRAYATDSIQQTHACQLLGDEIVRLRAATATIVSGGATELKLDKLVEVATLDAGVESHQLESIESRPAAAIEGTQLARQATVIKVTQVDLFTLAAMTTSLLETSEVEVSRVTLQPPAVEFSDGLETWDVELTLTVVRSIE